MLHQQHRQSGQDEDRDFADAHQRQQIGRQEQKQRFAVLDGRLSQPKKGLDDDCKDDRFDAAEKRFDERHFAVLFIEHSQQQHDCHGRKDETNARQKQSDFPAALVAQRDSQFRRVRTGNQIRESEQIHEFRLFKPFPLRHQFVLHHGDVCGWTPKSEKTQSGKNKANFLVDFFGIGHEVPPSKI